MPENTISNKEKEAPGNADRLAPEENRQFLSSLLTREIVRQITHEHPFLGPAINDYLSGRSSDIHPPSDEMTTSEEIYYRWFIANTTQTALIFSKALGEARIPPAALADVARGDAFELFAVALTPDPHPDHDFHIPTPFQNPNKEQKRRLAMTLHRAFRLEWHPSSHSGQPLELPEIPNEKTNEPMQESRSLAKRQMGLLPRSAWLPFSPRPQKEKLVTYQLLTSIVDDTTQNPRVRLEAMLDLSILLNNVRMCYLVCYLDFGQSLLPTFEIKSDETTPAIQFISNILRSTEVHPVEKLSLLAFSIRAFGAMNPSICEIAENCLSSIHVNALLPSQIADIYASIGSIRSELEPYSDEKRGDAVVISYHHTRRKVHNEPTKKIKDTFKELYMDPGNKYLVRIIREAIDAVKPQIAADLSHPDPDEKGITTYLPKFVGLIKMLGYRDIDEQFQDVQDIVNAIAANSRLTPITRYTLALELSNLEEVANPVPESLWAEIREAAGANDRLRLRDLKVKCDDMSKRKLAQHVWESIRFSPTEVIAIFDTSRFQSGKFRSLYMGKKDSDLFEFIVDGAPYGIGWSVRRWWTTQDKVEFFMGVFAGRSLNDCLQFFHYLPKYQYRNTQRAEVILTLMENLNQENDPVMKDLCTHAVLVEFVDMLTKEAKSATRQANYLNDEGRAKFKEESFLISYAARLSSLIEEALGRSDPATRDKFMQEVKGILNFAPTFYTAALIRSFPGEIKLLKVEGE